MLGKASEVQIREFACLSDYEMFQKQRPNAEIVSLQIYPIQQSNHHQYSIAIYVVYKS